MAYKVLLAIFSARTSTRSRNINLFFFHVWTSTSPRIPFKAKHKMCGAKCSLSCEKQSHFEILLAPLINNSVMSPHVARCCSFSKCKRNALPLPQLLVRFLSHCVGCFLVRLLLKAALNVFLVSNT